MERYERNTTTIDGDAVDIYSSATLTYADTSEHEFAASPTELEYYKNLAFEIEITYDGNPSDVNLTVGFATSNKELTGANAISQLDSDYWETLQIDLNTSGGTDTEYYLVRIPAYEINGKFVYAKYQYSGDPSNDPTVEVTLNKV